jgi:hypothetical protein
MRASDLEELKKRVSDVAEVALAARWGELAPQIPMSRLFVRPESEGSYMAVEWRARWVSDDGGPILCEVAGYLGAPDSAPAILEAREIIKSGFF